MPESIEWDQVAPVYDTYAVNEIIRRRTDCRASCRISSSPLRGKLTFYDTE